MAAASKTLRAHSVVENLYRDSVALMQLSSTLTGMDGIVQASAVVASESNLELLRDSGLLEGPVGAGPSDVLIAVEATSKSAVESGLEAAASMLLDEQVPGGQAGREESPPPSIAAAFGSNADANLALISTPGEYAGSEAMKALKLGLNVMLFSDNVSEDDEVMLKRYGRERGLLVMGPDCGTAIVNGVPLAFANVVARGSIGVVAASGTGLQQVTCLIDRFGAGVSQAVGTGGHDLHEHVGGITMLQAFEALEQDPRTDLIVLVSKPPSDSVAAKIIAVARRCKKPVVVNFLSPEAEEVLRDGIQFVRTLEDAARAAVDIAAGGRFTNSSGIPAEIEAEIRRQAADIGGGKFIRGLFSGGTFCYEALILMGRRVGPVYSNTAIDSDYALEDVWKSLGHCAVDLGDDEFTRGRPHPMIDHRLRNDRIVAEAADPETAVILLDVVLGYGSHPDPASEMVAAIDRARKVAKGRRPMFIGSLCGTPADPQGLERQEAALRGAGVLLAESNAQAALWAAEAVRGLA